ncbi:MAG: response regulator transcription factor [Eubacteriales bacterium]|nr:response regulator transcription factor [Eubacteriales bacterium]
MIYCVEDDDSSRELMVYTLRTAGFRAAGFTCAADFWTAVEENEPELVILDIMLPGEDGISMLKALRAHPRLSSIPVVMATAKGNEYDKVMGLELGADDYLVKPFGMMEMVSRVRAVLRRSGKSDATGSLRVGIVELNPVRHSIQVDGKNVELTLKEFALLQLMMSHVGQAFTRDALLSAVWNNDYEGETRTVDVHIGTLRMKLGVAGEYIKTVRGVGYKMEEVR